MFKKCKFNIGLTLLVQSASFVILFFMLYNKKRSLANTFLALSAIGGIAGAYLVLKEAKNEVEACEQAAKDACEYECGEDDAFCFDECENCYGDCSECTGMPREQAACEIIVEDSTEEEVAVDDEVVDNAAEETLEEEAVAEEPAEDIFTEPVTEA